MKKLLIAICCMLGFARISSAQVAAKKPVEKTAAVIKPAEAKVVKMDKTKPASAVPLKADGTPDKRYKENKATTAAVPLKKDGTPDKRYKANKKG
jgi:hypothetical protein